MGSSVVQPVCASSATFLNSFNDVICQSFGENPKVAPKTMVKSLAATNESNVCIPIRRDMVDFYTQKMSNFFWYHRAMSNTTRNIKLVDSIMGYEHTIATHTSLYIKFCKCPHHISKVDYGYYGLRFMPEIVDI
ncbi:hypothetical protein V2J09_018747 [Rumex salicifolius]